MIGIHSKVIHKYNSSNLYVRLTWWKWFSDENNYGNNYKYINEILLIWQKKLLRKMALNSSEILAVLQNLPITALSNCS